MIRTSISSDYGLRAIQGKPAERQDAINARPFAWIGMIALAASALCLGQGTQPSIKAGVSAGAFGNFTTIAPGSWIEIYGANLAAASRTWAGGDFNGVNAPTSLDGTSVTIGGQAAFIDYIGAGQVNAQVPSNVATGSQQVIVKTASGSSAPYSITVNGTQPGLLAPPSFNKGGVQYAAALFSDGATFVLPPGAIAGVTSRRAQPGDTITLYGIGFGPVVPGIPAGQVVQQTNTLASTLQVKFGSTLATVTYDGLAPSAVGLYQINVVVPTIPSNDAVPLTFTLGGVAAAQSLYLPVQSANATPQVQSLMLSANSVASGGTVTGTVTFSVAAPTGGIVVSLSSSSSAASVPSTVTVPAGATSAAFTVTAGSVSAATSATITASYQGSSAQATLGVTPPGGGVLPKFFLLQAIVSFTSGGIETAACNIMALVGTEASIGPCAFASSVSSSNGFGVAFNTTTVSGQTVSLTSVEFVSVMYDRSNAPHGITSGSVTLTLNPESTNQGTLTGNFTLVSSLATLSGTVSGTYQVR